MLMPASDDGVWHAAARRPFSFSRNTVSCSIMAYFPSLWSMTRFALPSLRAMVFELYDLDLHGDTCRLLFSSTPRRRFRSSILRTSSMGKSGTVSTVQLHVVERAAAW